MIKDLIKVANRLDAKGLTKEADLLDALIKKIAQNKRLMVDCKPIIASASLDSYYLEEDLEIFNLDKILSNLDGYDKVFLTELGSLYLYKEDHGCQRWKKISDHWREQPVMEKLFFLNKEGQERLIQEGASQQYLPFDERPWITLDLGDYAIGSYPLELRTRGLGVSFKVEGRQLNMKLNGPFHIGHKITEIIR